jgi:hypothetical protein
MLAAISVWVCERVFSPYAYQHISIRRDNPVVVPARVSAPFSMVAVLASAVREFVHCAATLTRTFEAAVICSLRHPNIRSHTAPHFFLVVIIPAATSSTISPITVASTPAQNGFMYMIIPPCFCFLRQQ